VDQEQHQTSGLLVVNEEGRKTFGIQSHEIEEALGKLLLKKVQSL
jgi:hypothetical protein